MYIGLLRSDAYRAMLSEDTVFYMNMYLKEKGQPDHKFEIDAIRILEKRYFLKNRDTGMVVEDPSTFLVRVAAGVVQNNKFNSDEELNIVMEKMSAYINVMANLDFLPNSPTLMNAGLPDGQLAACFVVPVEDNIDDIYDAIKNVAKIHKSGGGTGMDFSKLRPMDDIVKSTAGVASGPISFMKVFDASTEQIKQGGRRRGANMGILRVDHPDIEQFIVCKADNVSFNNFNISVAVTDKFMQAVERDTTYELIHPKTKKVVREVEARFIWNLLVDNAWISGDPGVVFIDQINERQTMLGAEHKIAATNPCGEQPLESYEACNLGSINLKNFIKRNNGSHIDFDRLAEVATIAVQFLDDVIDSCVYPLPEIDVKVKSNRKIGLGVMGFADVLVEAGIRYGSDQSYALAEQIMEFIEETAIDASQMIAEELGVFPTFNESTWAQDGLRVRNATLTTIAPTGTISMLANGTSSGVEPLFALAFKKTVMDGQEFYYVHPSVEKLKSENLLTDAEYQGILDTGVAPLDVLKKYPHLVTAQNGVTPNEHVMMQAAFQNFTDNAVSKTVNLLNNATREDIDAIYKLSYSSGCKGVTVFRDGCKGEQVLTTGHDTKVEVVEEVVPKVLKKKDRPDVLDAKAIKIKTGCGNLYVNLSVDAEGNPQEIFCHLGKSGGCASSQAEGIGRLVSGWFRAGIDPREAAEQLRGISCGKPAFVEGGKVLSCSDAIGIVIEKYLDGVYPIAKHECACEGGCSALEEKKPYYISKVASAGMGACSECGGPVEFEGGCSVCRVCAASKCG